MKVTGIQCLKCKDKIWSIHTHDFRWCKCHAVAIDGGRSYMRICGALYNYKCISLNVKASDSEKPPVSDPELHKNWGKLSRKSVGMLREWEERLATVRGVQSRATHTEAKSQAERVMDETKRSKIRHLAVVASRQRSDYPQPPLGFSLIATEADRIAACRKKKGDMVWLETLNVWAMSSNGPLRECLIYARKTK